ncbi:type VI secretion system baseplate subunit TssG [uncultured Desulfobacter sp.]|uniref:type VI secretion system baseplate subunit TssG n=1 Tax=uncultured Desulfobacter sp. TaxID=240139 RepID=UPI002AABD56F|nr:type VI secretion system baseplate subunit TssG [uncultured Desulfobacter sp.]
MAAEDRKQDSQITDLLTERPGAFSFIQALRLLIKEVGLRESCNGGEITRNEILEKLIRIRPELSLTFPGTDMAGVEKLDHEPSRFLINATFLGLYGASSPLPTFYTEDLIEERSEGKSIKRDFIDIINYGIYTLFFRIWSKHRLFYRLCEEQDQDAVNLIYCLLGLENKGVRTRVSNINKFYRYTGLAMQFPRSAEGLVSILEDCFNLKGRVEVNQCTFRTVAIPEDQYALLGKSCCTIGEDLVLGHWVADMSGKFQIVISDADPCTLHALLPDQPLFTQFRQMVDFYVNQPLEWELVIEPVQDLIETVQPGSSSWSSLGWNTWLAPDMAGTGPQRAVTFKAAGY